MWKESILKLLRLDSLVSNLTGYVETRIELMKLEVKEEIAKSLAKVSVLVIVIASLSLFVLFFSV
ncbi:MAG: phage holin family protein, partial [Cytophagia bacterium]|nr:phage holin family protein [Cytophagia bacterium]